LGVVAVWGGRGGGAGGGGGGGGRDRGHGPLTPYLFLLPFGVLFIGFVLIPAIFGLWVSLHDYNYLLPGKPWVGLQNYLDLFTPGSRDSGDFWKSMLATGIFTVFSVPFLIVCPLGVALLLNRAFKGRSFFRAVFFAPYVLGVAVVGILFRFVLDPNIGLVNYYLGHAIPWTTEVPWAWVSLIGMTVWWTLGFNAVIYLAGLQDISPELYEAARVDGASLWDEFRNVTIPGLRPVMAFVTTVTILASANMFGQSFLLTKGAPANETRTAIMYIAQTGLSNNRQGMAAAMSYLLALALMGISVLNMRFTRRRDAS
jgi:multiple sugar transport system permease protein